MIRRLLRKRRTVPRRAAAEALGNGSCMFAGLGECAQTGAVPVGLRDHDDIDAVLVCSQT